MKTFGEHTPKKKEKNFFEGYSPKSSGAPKKSYFMFWNIFRNIDTKLAQNYREYFTKIHSLIIYKININVPKCDFVSISERTFLVLFSEHF